MQMLSDKQAGQADCRMAEQVAQNTRQILEQVARAARESGRDPGEIQVMAVTKTVPPQLVNQAIASGIRLLGENKAQELCEKYDHYHREDVQIHFIGHLQTNKVRQIVDKVSMIHSVDSLRLAKEIQRLCQARGKVMPVLVEVNIGGEESKSGVSPQELPALLEELAKLDAIRVSGLMTIPPACEELQRTEHYFCRMQKLFVDIRAKKLDNIHMEHLSMGMSHDYLTAVRCGATIVRIGTALFGKREYAVR